MVTAGMAAAAVVAAGMAFAVLVVMVAAAHVGVEVQLVGQQGLYSLVCLTGNAAVQTDVGGSQRHLCTAADAAADQNVGVQSVQHTSQRTVTAAVGVYHLGGNHLAVLDVIDLKLLGVAKMLENHTVFISNCNSHKRNSFRFIIHLMNLLFETGAAAAAVFAFAQAIVAAFDTQGPTFHKGFCQLFACCGIDLLDGGSGHLHKPAAGLLVQSFLVDQTDGFVFIDGQDHRRQILLAFFRQKGLGTGKVTDFSTFSRPCHNKAPSQTNLFYHYTPFLTYVNKRN